MEWTPDERRNDRLQLVGHQPEHDARTLCASEDRGNIADRFGPHGSTNVCSGVAELANQGSVPVAFFDADSTLRVSANGSITPDSPDDVMLLPGVAKGINKAASQGMLIAIVSNQGGVARGHTTLDNAEKALARTAELIVAKGAPIHYFDFAPNYDHDRKPGTGMAEELEQRIEDAFGLSVDWASTTMVGDAGWKRGVDTEPDGTPGEDFSHSDRGFAEALGIDFQHPRDYFGWAALGVRNFHKPDQVDAFRQANPDFDD